MNVAVIGAGSIGQRHVRGVARLRDELGVKAIRVYDPNEERRQAAVKLGTDITACDSVSDALTGVEAVLICAPTSLHTQVMRELLDAGNFHVFMEKPLASDAAGWATLIEEQTRRGKVFGVGYLLRKHPVLNRLRGLLADGALGRVLHVRAESGFYLPYWHPHEDYRHFYMSSRTGGGGALLDTSHEIDYLTWLFGKVDEVQGTVQTISDLEITSDDMVLATFRFRSGVVGQVHLDLLQFDESRYCKVIGTKAVVRADIKTNELHLWAEGDKEWTVEKFSVEWDEVYGDEYRDFFRVCRGGEAPLVPGRDALHVMEIIEATRRSHSSGTRVRLPLWDLA
ncbi:MAG: Gfo/Idh/MocA family oxidoreductase [Acidobacteria bacterium]|nr:Gfo/Idh/MocA family oxidoreductase [Acidobacteriota bacterium]